MPYNNQQSTNDYLEYLHQVIFSETNSNWKSFKITSNDFEDIKKNIPRSPGIYQIKTDAPINELLKVQDRKDPNHYNFKKKIDEALKLPNALIIQEDTLNGYIVYTGHQANLRQRFNEHFKGTKGTGCLSIFENENLQAYNWWFEYFDCSNIIEYNDSKLYRTFLEQFHRNKIGWPILCSQ